MRAVFEALSPDERAEARRGMLAPGCADQAATAALGPSVAMPVRAVSAEMRSVEVPQNTAKAGRRITPIRRDQQQIGHAPAMSTTPGQKGPNDVGRVVGDPAR
jgi:hypothetical protein